MIPQRSDRCRAAMIALHRRKSASYGNAWKKRGELISILCNLARKVDRIEVIARDATVVSGEALLDTVVDLLVYAVKYETYLADIDVAVASELFPSSVPARPFSDGAGGFETLLKELDLSALDREVVSGLVASGDRCLTGVVTAFGAVETAAAHSDGAEPPIDRLLRVEQLIVASLEALATIVQHNTHEFDTFCASEISGGSGA